MVVSSTLESRVEALIRVSSIPPTSAGLMFSKSLVSRGNSTWWVNSQHLPCRGSWWPCPKEARGWGGCVQSRREGMMQAEDYVTLQALQAAWLP